MNRSDVINVLKEEAKTVKSFAFLTQRPVVVVLNVNESDIGSPPSLDVDESTVLVTLSAEIEAEIAQFDEADRPEFMADGMRRAVTHAVARASGSGR